MKKISILGIALLAVGSMTAQQQVVKDAERQLKADAKSYPKVIETLKPAFTDPATAKDANTWYVAGKGAFDYVNNVVALERITGELDKGKAANAVLDGFVYLQTALPLDTIVDEKGKVKTKHSKNIVKTLVSNYDMAQNAGLWFYNDLHDYSNAAKAWEFLFTLPQQPALEKAGLKAYPDSTMGMFSFYQGCALASANDNPGALRAFERAIKYGYNDVKAYDYAVSTATQMNDYAKAAEIAQDGYNKYHKGNFLGIIVNNYLNSKEFDKANQFLDEYIAQEPANGELYYLKGVIADSQNNLPEALELYKKATELSPENSQALMMYGAKLCEKANKIAEEESKDITQAQYDKINNEKIFPLYREAATYLEKAYSLNNDLKATLNVLRSIYYQLKDETNLQRIDQLREAE